MAPVTVRGIRSPSVESGREVHVLPHPDGWAVSRAKANCRVFITRAYALAAADEIAKRHHAELVVHNEDGLTEVVASYLKSRPAVVVPAQVTLTAGH
jgi:hypothetical protein